MREATDADLPSIAPFFRETVGDGETYAFPEDLDDEGVRAWWFERSSGGVQQSGQRGTICPPQRDHRRTPSWLRA